MSNNKFNARHGLSVGSTPIDIVDDTGAILVNSASATKLATSRTIAITGDVTYTSGSFDGTANVTGTATLASSGVTAGSYGSTSAIPVITIDAKGRVTSASTASVTVPTLTSQLTNDSGFATQTYVNSAVSNLVAAAPAALDTLNELAAALGNDASFATTTATNLGLKALKTTTISAGTGLTGGGDLSANRTLTLATSGVTAGTYNNVTIDVYGRATSGSNVAYLTSYTETSTLANVTARGASTSTAITFSGGITSAGATLSGNLLFSNATSPYTNYIQFGDNTGWNLRIMTSVSGTPTQRFNFSDQGAFSAVGAITGSNLSGTNTGDETTATIKTKLGITTLSGSNTGDQTITLTGDITGSGTGSFATTLAASGVTAGTYTKITVDAKGRATSGTTLSASDVPTLNQNTTGTSASAPLLSGLGSYVWSASTLPTGYPQGIQASFVQGTNGWQNYGSVMTMNTYSGGGGALQLYVPYSPNNGGVGLQARFGNYDVSSGNSWTSWKTLLASDNYNSYSPSLTGSGASGTWGISVTGSAGSVSGGAVSASSIYNSGFWYTFPDGSRDASAEAWYPNVVTRGLAPFFANASTVGTGGNYAGVLQFNPWVGSTASTGDASYQLVFGSTATNGGGTPQLRIRKGIDTTWNSFYDVLTSANYSSYALPLSGGDMSGRIRMGTFSSSTTNSGEAWIGRASDRAAGTMTVQLGVANARTFEVVDYAWSTVILAAGMDAFTYKGSTILHAGNYTSYPPTSISGLTLTSSSNGINPDNVTQNQLGYNTSVSLFGQTDGGLYSSAYSSSWIHQIYGDFRTGQIAIRGKNSGTWQAWRTVLDSSNFTNYAPGSYSSWYFTDIYANSWIRNINTNTGLYNQATGSHWYSENGGSFTLGSPSTSYGEIRLRQNHQGTYKGSFYWDGSGIGLLNEQGGWSVRCNYGTGYGGTLFGTWTGGNIRANRANGNFYIDDNYGNGVVGVYSSYRYQGVFAMGDSYKLPADGTTTGSLYGIAWSHPNAGGTAGNLDSHGMLVLINGGYGSSMSYSIKASGNVTAYSDERLKTNWRDMPESYVSKLAKVKVGIYDRTDGEQITQVGVSAQSLQAILPEAVITATDDMKTLSVNYGGAALASAVELAKDNVELRSRIEKLEALVLSLLNKE